MAFVVSTTYRDATSRVRSLVTRIPNGRAYAVLYVYAVLFGLAILVLPLWGEEPTRLTLLILSLLLALVATSFGQLRTQLYGLLEPVKLLPVIQRDMARWINYALRSGSSSQRQRVAISRRRALDSIETLRDLGRLIRAREQQSFSHDSKYASIDPRALTIVHSITSIWIAYATKKQELSRVEEWGVPREQHKDWLTASTFEVDTALNTSTTLQPDSPTDGMWFERHLSSILADQFDDRAPAQLDDLVGRLSPIPRYLAAQGQFEEVRLWSDVVVATAMDAITPRASDGPSSKSTSSLQVTVARQHNLIDFSILAYAQTVLGLYDYVSTLRKGFPEWMVHQAQGEDKRRIGPQALDLFHELRDALTFEYNVEGRRITSNANLYQLAARSIASEVVDQIDLIIEQLEGTLLPWVLGLSETPELPAAAALSRMDELLHKLDGVLVSSAEELFDACESVHHDVDDKWPELSMVAQREKIDAMTQQMRLPIARMSARVDLELDSDRPDAFGWAFYRAHDDLLGDVLEQGRPSELQQRLRYLATATDRAAHRLRSTVRRTHVSIAYSYQAEPFLLFLQVSGIAYAQARLNGRSELFRDFAEVWSDILDSKTQAAVDLLLGVLDADQDHLGIAPGRVRRLSRSQRAKSHFDSLRRKDFAEMFEHGEDEHDGKTMDAASVEIANHLHLDGGFEQVFVAAWLLPEALARGADIHHGEVAGQRFWSFYERLSSNVTDTGGNRPGETRGGVSE
ncbi:hypothetical protein [Janibacter cremeus]|uniref:Uncharacterized protein n=1 Tax=Janibacter cremeus TaxID=1285192 RepID=A0A852VLI1_9MICO|nr:hypothetical protein [Janibacter cremeus]NYF97882.1 hypothetical protein [Janibacter cremeus]